MQEKEILDLLTALIEKPSVTPDDAGCMALIQNYIEKDSQGIRTSYFNFNNTKNQWITHGHGNPVTAFVGHVDVVPPGDLSLWQTPPFEAIEKEGYIYGRGASDMKSGVAAMCVAFKHLCKSQPDHQGTLALLLTSDEEGMADDGIQSVLPALKKGGIHIDYSIVGEPTSNKKLGDTARNGRRGSLNLKLTVHGKQGHVAYPQDIKNPIHAMTEIGSEISQIVWDSGNQYFPASSCQISNIQAGTGAENMVPETAMAMINWRFNTEQSPEKIEQRVTSIVEKICDKHQVKADYNWRLSGLPFCTENQLLMNALHDAVKDICQLSVEFNTAGGTSDARFLAAHGSETIEFGPSNHTIHKINECIRKDDLHPLSMIYYQTITNLWSQSHS